jgi:putative solute:sodium symporter small subunit
MSRSIASRRRGDRAQLCTDHSRAGNEATAAAGTRSQYWHQTRRLTAALLATWFTVTFILTYFARNLRFTFLGWPFSFYMAAQGSLLIYLLIVYLYARRQRTRDEAFGVAEPEAD